MKKTISLLTIALLLNFVSATHIFAASKEAEFAEKVKTQIAKLGVGQDAQVKIKLRDGAKVKGFISEVSYNQFAVTDSETGRVTKVDYPNVKQVKGNNLSTGVKIVIGIGVLIAVVFILGSLAK
jgi:uncharacterized protein (DUF58 family)